MIIRHTLFHVRGVINFCLGLRFLGQEIFIKITRIFSRIFSRNIFHPPIFPKIISENKNLKKIRDKMKKGGIRDFYIFVFFVFFVFFFFCLGFFQKLFFRFFFWENWRMKYFFEIILIVSNYL